MLDYIWLDPLYCYYPAAWYLWLIEAVLKPMGTRDFLVTVNPGLGCSLSDAAQTLGLFPVGKGNAQSW